MSRRTDDEDSDVIAGFRAMKEMRREERAFHGVDCPWCKSRRPKANPSKLLPGQRCRVDGYLDPRLPIELEQHLGALEMFALAVEPRLDEGDTPEGTKQLLFSHTLLRQLCGTIRELRKELMLSRRRF